MEKLVEISRVEETRHLVPNLPRLAAAIFGKHSYFLGWFKRHIDWATEKGKHPDGLVWRPWARELWLVEAEWKEGSNFFDQSRALASGRVNRENLVRELRGCLKSIENVIDSATPSLKKGFVLDNIVEETLTHHVINGELRPHAWVVLGHDVDNLEKLIFDYEKELQARFRGNQRYILTMVRMFQSESITFLLLEQNCSPHVSVDRAILVPSVYQAVSQTMSKELVSKLTQQITPDTKPTVDISLEGTVSGAPKGRASQVWEHIYSIDQELDRTNVRLRIQTSKERFEDFHIDWEHSGVELMVMHQGIRRKPADAAKRAMADSLPTTTSNIARKYGKLVDVSETPVRIIAQYREVDMALWKASRSKKQLNGETETIFPILPTIDAKSVVSLKDESLNYFSNWTPQKARKAQSNILQRRKLWEAFIEKQVMTTQEFKRLSHFDPKAIAGFMLFLTRNGLATRSGDVFTLNESIVPHIQRLLDEKNQRKT